MDHQQYSCINTGCADLYFRGAHYFEKCIESGLLWIGWTAYPFFLESASEYEQKQEICAFSRIGVLCIIVYLSRFAYFFCSP